MNKTATSSTPEKKATGPDWWLFFRKFLTQGRKIASFVPSSVWMAKAVLKGIDFENCSTILELGAGTGPITTQLLKQAPDHCRCVILEREPDFCVRLRKRFPQAEILEADASHLAGLLKERGIKTVDHILCGLPLPSFAEEDRDRVLGCALNHLRPEGTFRQLTHLPWVYRRMYRRYFDQVKFHMVFRNLPPAGFYICRGRNLHQEVGQASELPMLTAL